MANWLCNTENLQQLAASILAQNDWQVIDSNSNRNQLLYFYSLHMCCTSQHVISKEFLTCYQYEKLPKTKKLLPSVPWTLILGQLLKRLLKGYWLWSVYGQYMVQMAVKQAHWWKKENNRDQYQCQPPRRTTDANAHINICLKKKQSGLYSVNRKWFPLLIKCNQCAILKHDVLCFSTLTMHIIWGSSDRECLL